ncbi:MAG: hypothetical protein HGA65_00390 [Oscillochloris sp.]|nr:hypothetical protein [Oscillochloris sp.]
MADGDVLRLKIPGPYAKAYRQTCEGSGTPEEVARKKALGIIQHLRWYGDAPRQMLLTVASKLAPLTNTLFLPDRATVIEMGREIERIHRAMSGHKEGISHAAAACRSLLNDLARGRRFVDLNAELAHRFVTRVYDATFVARVETAPHHLYNASHKSVQQRMAVGDPSIRSYIRSLSRQWLGQPNIDNLRLPPRPQSKVDLDTQLD